MSDVSKGPALVDLASAHGEDAEENILQYPDLQVIRCFGSKAWGGGADLGGGGRGGAQGGSNTKRGRLCTLPSFIHAQSVAK